MILQPQLSSVLVPERSHAEPLGRAESVATGRGQAVDGDGKAVPGATEDFIDPIHDPAWDRLVTAHADASLFHHSAWAKVLASTYGHKPYYLSVGRDEDGAHTLVPMMEVKSRFTGKRGVCLPFSDFCSPLTAGTMVTTAVMDRINRLARQRGWKHVEWRGARPAIPFTARPSATYFVHTLDLRSGSKALFANFNSSVQRAIRKAEQSQLKVEVTQSHEAMMEFFALHTQTRRRHGLPPQPLRFFLNIHREVIQPAMGFIVRVTRGGKPVASLMFFTLGPKAIYKFGASDIAEQNCRGNNLAIWTALQFLCQQGAESLHFGRTSAGEEGTRRFKLGWGVKEDPLEYYRYSLRSGSWQSSPDHLSGRHNSVFGRLPLFLNRIAGWILYPHLD
jgi:hypothetical protein